MGYLLLTIVLNKEIKLHDLSSCGIYMALHICVDAIHVDVFFPFVAYSDPLFFLFNYEYVYCNPSYGPQPCTRPVFYR